MAIKFVRTALCRMAHQTCRDEAPELDTVPSGDSWGRVLRTGLEAISCLGFRRKIGRPHQTALRLAESSKREKQRQIRIGEHGGARARKANVAKRSRFAENWCRTSVRLSL